MAEAHQAVAFSFAITHEGVHINYDLEVLTIVWASGLRSYKKRFFGFVNNLKNGVYPSSVEFLFSILLFVFTCQYAFRLDTSFGLVNLIQRTMAHFLPASWTSRALGLEITAILAWGVFIWFVKALAMRYLLKVLLVYKGWMYETRSAAGISVWTKCWLPLVSLLTIKKPQLYSYQASLPRLPVPSVDDTVRRYLRSIQPLCKTDADYERIVKLADDFKAGISSRLQRYLVLKSWWATNYVSDWWEEFVYLRGRQPLMINSNFYGIDAVLIKSTNRPTSRAANLIHSALLFRRQIDRQELKPMLVQGLVPLCSWQYERMFNTTRLPSLETDKLVHFTDSQHVIVLCDGKYYKLNIYHRGKLQTPKQLERNLDRIHSDAQQASDAERHLACLTAADRVTWAKARYNYFRKGVNRASLDLIEKAAFVVVFEPDNFEYDENDPSKLDRYAQALLHGRGYDRWFDKSFNIVIGKNGLAGFNGEHSWADAPVMAHLWEFVLATDQTVLKYEPDGRCAFGDPSDSQLVPPSRLQWQFTDELCSKIERCLVSAQQLVDDVDLKLINFNTYGKGLMKHCKVSPDAYIQMALQLAYFHDSGENFCLTYEASMTRLYRDGRTETVRPVTIESAAWVRSMQDPSRSLSDRVALFRHACAQHQRGYQDAMCGKGIDRHLFCLYVISKYLEVDSPFLKEVLSEPWKLSTSQTPMGQAGMIDLRKHPEYISAGGGFGPVADDGYGVSYIVSGENHLFFHISSKRSSGQTDSLRFGKRIIKALNDIRDMHQLGDKQ